MRRARSTRSGRRRAFEAVPLNFTAIDFETSQQQPAASGVLVGAREGARGSRGRQAGGSIPPSRSASTSTCSSGNTYSASTAITRPTNIGRMPRALCAIKWIPCSTSRRRRLTSPQRGVRHGGADTPRARRAALATAEPALPVQPAGPPQDLSASTPNRMPVALRNGGQALRGLSPTTMRSASTSEGNPRTINTRARREAARREHDGGLARKSPAAGSGSSAQRPTLPRPTVGPPCSAEPNVGNGRPGQPARFSSGGTPG